MLRLADRSRRLDQTWVDLALVLLLMVIPVLAGVGGDAGYLFDVLAVAPLVLRRRAPVVAFTAVCLLLLWQSIVMDDLRWGDISLLIALHAIAAHGPLWAARAGLGVGLLGAAIATVRWSGLDRPVDDSLRVITPLVAVVIASWALGWASRTRRDYVESLEARAAQLERDAEQQTTIATAAERARIAREMHDVVAHSLSIMVVQADGALHASRKRPEVATETLRTISETGRSSLTEMRKLLGLLRSDGDGPPLAPLPDAAAIPDLVEQLRGSGLPVELTITGRLEDPDPASGLTAYRIIQEALTNTLRHAGSGAHASVDVVVTADAIALRIDDDGRGATVGDDAAGHGIVGMRERIAVHSGHVEAGPRPGGGFRVDATVPSHPLEGA